MNGNIKFFLISYLAIGVTIFYNSLIENIIKKRKINNEVPIWFTIIIILFSFCYCLAWPILPIIAWKKDKKEKEQNKKEEEQNEK